MHRQNHPCAEALHDLDHGCVVQCRAAIHGSHDHIKPPDRRVLVQRGFMVQVAQVADAQPPRDFEHEDGVAIFAPPAGPPTARIGMHVADQHVAKVQMVVLREIGSAPPTFQNMLNALLRVEREMGGMRIVHGDRRGHEATAPPRKPA